MYSQVVGLNATLVMETAAQAESLCFFGRNTRMLDEAVESSPSPCKLDHGGLEPNAIAIYEEVMYRTLPLIHSSHPPHL